MRIALRRVIINLILSHSSSAVTETDGENQIQSYPKYIEFKLKSENPFFCLVWGSNEK